MGQCAPCLAKVQLRAVHHVVGSHLGLLHVIRGIHRKEGAWYCSSIFWFLCCVSQAELSLSVQFDSVRWLAVCTVHVSLDSLTKSSQASHVSGTVFKTCPCLSCV